MNKLRIGYFADGPWAHAALRILIHDKTLDVVFICARHDSTDEILKCQARDNNIDFISHSNINSSEFMEQMRGFGCDLFVSMSFNQIFRSGIINLPPLKSINCHAGKLPRYRGRNILNWALINDERDFGITVHYINEGIDTGDIILQRCYPIDDEDDYSTLLNRAYSGCAEILYEAIKKVQFLEVDAMPQKSIDSVGFYCIARKAGDEILDWHQSSREIFNFVRAICRPGPEARTYAGDVELKINKVQYLPEAPKYKGIPGSVIGVEDNAFLVKTLDSFVRVTEWSGGQRPRIGVRLK
jgi:methionyl-tRNA formyltransferase